MKTKKIDEALIHCYIELFDKSVPRGNFNDIVANAIINKFGQKEIPFLDYEIEEQKMIEIINDTIKKFKIKGHYQQMFRNTIWLGCSPKTKKIEI